MSCVVRPRPSKSTLNLMTFFMFSFGLIGAQIENVSAASFHRTKVVRAPGSQRVVESVMKTIDCLTLERLLENRQPVKLIDIRSKQEFRASHIPEARSVPFAELAT